MFCDCCCFFFVLFFCLAFNCRKGIFQPTGGKKAPACFRILSSCMHLRLCVTDAPCVCFLLRTLRPRSFPCRPRFAPSSLQTLTMTTSWRSSSITSPTGVHLPTGSLGTHAVTDKLIHMHTSTVVSFKRAQQFDDELNELLLCLDLIF